MPPSAILAVVLAVCSAFCYASAAALQRVETARVAASADRPPSGLPFFRALVRRPRWWAGVASQATGAGIHVVALGLASVTLVQPIGVGALVLALPIDARLERRRVRRGEWVAAAVLVVALGGMLTFAPHRGDEVRPGWATVITTAAIAVGAVALLLLASARVPPVPRAVLRAAGAGVCAGATSGLVRLTIQLFTTDRPFGLVAVAGGAAVALPVAGVALLQTAYRDGGLDAALATQTAIDPAIAITIGVAVLGERFTAGVAGSVGAVACAAVAVVALVSLIRAGPTPGGGLPPVREPVATARGAGS